MANELELSRAAPTIFILAPQLWTKCTLVVRGVGIGGPPDYAPFSKYLSALPKPVAVTDPIHIGVVGGRFEFPALSLLLVTNPANTGTIKVSIARAQDISPTPPHHAPHLDIEFTRARGDDVILEKFITLKGTP